MYLICVNRKAKKRKNEVYILNSTESRSLKKNNRLSYLSPPDNCFALTQSQLIEKV